MADRQGELASLVEQAIRNTGKAKQVEGGTEWEFYCFDHPDSTEPHAYWNRRKGTWYCQKCGLKGSTYELAQRFGIELREDKQRKEYNAQIIKEYDYRDRDGTLLFQVVRMHPKTFRVRRPSGNPERPWIWDRKGITPVLYNLPAIDAAPTDEWVLLLEGEKDVDRAIAEGWRLATTNPFGAQAPGKNGPAKPKWEPQYTESLRGRNVAICLDDDPAGGNSQRQVANILRGHVANLKLIKLPRMNPPTKKDLSDWFNDDGSIVELTAIINATPVEEAGPPTPDAVDSDDLLRFAMTDAGNGELFAHLYGNQVRFDHQRRRWLVWKGHWWGEDSDGQLRRWAVEMARLRAKAAADQPTEKEVVSLLKFASRSEEAGKIEATLKMASIQHPIADVGKGWDSAPMLIGVANGVVNLVDGTLRPGKQSDLITRYTSTAFDPHAKCPRWVQFIDEIFDGDREMTEYIHHAVGYSLTGSVAEQIWFLCYGKGANGKSTFLEVLGKALGSYAGNLPSAALIKTGNSKEHDLADLPGKRFVTASEVPDNVTLNEQRIKALTGADTINARQLYERQFSFEPELKLWVALNHLPAVSDSSEGFWRRVRVIGFNRQFAGFERDNDLKDKLLAELPGILNWAVQGAVKYFADKLPVPAKVLMATQDYQADSDPFRSFITECCIEAPNAMVKAGELFMAFEAWARDTGIRIPDGLGSVGFGKRCREPYTIRRFNDGIRYVGVGLRTDRNDAQGPQRPDRVGFSVGFGAENEFSVGSVGFSQNNTSDSKEEIPGEFLEKPYTPYTPYTVACLCSGRHDENEDPCFGGYAWEDPESGEQHCSLCHPEISNQGNSEESRS